jgi:hypothetical protein
VYSQDEQRVRRRGWLPVHYREQFDLTTEVSAIIGPLAEQLSALPRPLALRRDVDAVADAVHELVSAVVGMLAEAKHPDPLAHARTARAVADLAQRPNQPRVSDDQLCDGSWAAVLVSHVAPHREDLAAFLGRALAPNDPRLLRAAGQQSASQRLEAALRVLDLAALDLARRIPKAARYQALPSIESRNAARRAQYDAERARRQLAKMGIEETP